MWFTVVGFYKPGIDTRPAVLQAALNEHIGQLNLQIRLAGPLRGPDGKTIGLMVITRADIFRASRRLSSRESALQCRSL